VYTLIIEYFYFLTLIIVCISISDKNNYAYFPGYIHFEFLQLLSKQCQMELQTVFFVIFRSSVQIFKMSWTKYNNCVILNNFDFDGKIMTIEKFKKSPIN